MECDQTLPTDNATATDNCGQVTVTFTDREAPGDCPQERVITRTFTAVDECGNEDTATQTITIQDTQAPVLANTPFDITINCDLIEEAVTISATDNCSEVTIQFNEERVDGDCPHNYTLVRTWVAGDDCNNSTNHEQIVTVEDVFPPNITIPCLLYTSPSPRDLSTSRMPSSA